MTRSQKLKDDVKQSAASSSAASRALSVAELVEAILAHLPFIDLVRSRAVFRTSRQLVVNSPILRHHLSAFQRPIAAGQLDFHPGTGKYETLDGVEKIMHPALRNAIWWDRKLSTTYAFCPKTLLEKALPSEVLASFACQPTAKEAFMISQKIMVIHQREERLVKWTKKLWRDTGVKIGDIVDGVKELESMYPGRDGTSLGMQIDFRHLGR